MHFTAFGHKNILSTHRNTFEFTKDMNLTVNGDCIIGVNSDFEAQKLRKFTGRIIIKIVAGGCEDIIKAEANPYFNDDHEFVVRKTDFISKRTFAINADKAAKDLSKDLVQKLKDPKQKIIVEIEDEKTSA